LKILLQNLHLEERASSHVVVVSPLSLESTYQSCAAEASSNSLWRSGGYECEKGAIRIKRCDILSVGTTSAAAVAVVTMAGASSNAAMGSAAAATPSALSASSPWRVGVGRSERSSSGLASTAGASKLVGRDGVIPCAGTRLPRP